MNATADVKPVSLPPLPPKSGHLIGRAVFEDGRPVPEFTVTYSGFEDGKLARTTYGGNIIETITDTKSAKNGRYEVKLPSGAYRVSTYVTYRYHDRAYLFELEQLNPPQKHDYPGLRLDKLGNGLVRDLVLRMTGKRANTDESTESGYYHAYIGGRVNFDVAQRTGLLGGGNKFSPTVGEAFAAESRIEVTFVPQGPRVDGSTGTSVIANIALARSGSWTFSQRGIFPGVYTTAARVITPDGRATPLRVSLTPARNILGSGAAYDELVMDWKTSVLVDFLPNDIKPRPKLWRETGHRLPRAMSGPTRGEGRTLLRLSWAVLGACALGMCSLRAETPLPPEVPLEHAKVIAQRAAETLRPHPHLVHAQLYRGLENEAKVWALEFHDEETGDPITVLAAASRTLPPIVMAWHGLPWHRDPERIRNAQAAFQERSGVKPSGEWDDYRWSGAFDLWIAQRDSAGTPGFFNLVDHASISAETVAINAAARGRQIAEPSTMPSRAAAPALPAADYMADPTAGALPWPNPHGHQ